MGATVQNQGGNQLGCQGSEGQRLQRDQQGHQATWLKQDLIGFEMLAQGTLAYTGSTLVGLAAPTWASLQALLAGDLGRQGSWLRYWLVFAIAELFTLPIPYVKLASPVLLCLYLSKLALLIWCQLPIENNGSELIFGQVFFLREEFAKASCSFMDDADYDEGEKITVKYSLQRKFKIFLLRIKMKLYELIESS